MAPRLDADSCKSGSGDVLTSAEMAHVVMAKNIVRTAASQVILPIAIPPE
jgi:hypothetical protein